MTTIIKIRCDLCKKEVEVKPSNVYEEGSLWKRVAMEPENLGTTGTRYDYCPDCAVKVKKFLEGR